MSGLRLGSLFTGSGMLDEGVLSVLGGSVAWHAEIDPAASKVLAHRYPDVPNLGDLTAVDWSGVEPVDVLTGGFPCQDVSHAGKRAGMRAGTRSGLWARMCDAIDQLRPALVVAENVRGLLSAEADSALEPCPGCVGDDGDGAVLRALGRVLGDLADLRYDASWYGLRAADVGAPHGRFRVFIVATDAERGGRDGWASDPWRGAVGRVAATRTSRGAAADARRGSLARPAAARDGLRVTTERRDWATPDPTCDGWDEGRTQPAWIVGGPDAAERGATPTDAASTERRGREQQALSPDLHGARDDAEPRERGGAHHRPLESHLDAQWGQYGAAIRRWEQQLGRIAPAPTEAGAKGGQRLSPEFVTWMMGWPAGWVTDVPGISRNDALRICGNGVVPQQAAEALRRLLGASAVAA